MAFWMNKRMMMISLVGILAIPALGFALPAEAEKEDVVFGEETEFCATDECQENLGEENQIQLSSERYQELLHEIRKLYKKQIWNEE